jgi:hypothetical protein
MRGSRLRRLAVLGLTALGASSCLAPAAIRSVTRYPLILVAFDSATHVELTFGSGPVGYDHVIRIRGRLVATRGDTAEIIVSDVYFLTANGRVDAAVLHVTSRYGAPRASVIVDRGERRAREKGRGVSTRRQVGLSNWRSRRSSPTPPPPWNRSSRTFASPFGLSGKDG